MKKETGRSPYPHQFNGHEYPVIMFCFALNFSNNLSFI